MSPSDYPLVDVARKLRADYGYTKQVLGSGRLDILDKAGVACGAGTAFTPIHSPEEKKRFKCVLEGINVEFRYLATEEPSENEFTVKWFVRAKLGPLKATDVEVHQSIIRLPTDDLLLRGQAWVESGPVVEKFIKMFSDRINRAVQNTNEWLCKALEEVSKNPRNYLGSMFIQPSIQGPADQSTSVVNITLTPAPRPTPYKFRLVLDRSEATATVDIRVNQMMEDVKLEPSTWQSLLEDLHLHTFSDSGVRGGHDGHPHAQSQLERLERVGKDMFLYAVPKPIREELRQGRGHLRVTATPELFHLPWELLHDGERFLGIRYAIGRLILGTKKAKMRTRRDKVKFLFLADPTSNLDAALMEVELIAKTLSSSRMKSKIDITVWRQSEISKMRFLSALNSGEYDVVHFAGHGHFNAHKPDDSYLMFPKEREKGWAPCYPSEIARSLTDNPPAIFFANACSSARERSQDLKKSNKSEAGFAKTLIDAGVMCFVGSLWEVRDSRAAMLAATFYENIIEGVPFGEAMRKARERVFNESKNEGEISWAAMILYGDPALSFAPLTIAS